MRLRRLYLPVITILATVLTLFAMLGISTFRSLHRERVRIEESLFRDGLIVLRSTEASFRSGMVGIAGRTQSLQWLISQISDLTEIHFVGLVNEQGIFIAHNNDAMVGTPYPQRERLRELIRGGGPMSWIDENGRFIVAKRFRPLRSPWRMRGDMHGSPHSMMTMRGDMFDPILSDKTYALVGLDTTAFEQARSNDIYHAVMMGLILLVLGSASLYFVFLIQNYYVVNKTLDTMTTYATNVVENMPDGLISIDAEGKVVTVNNRVREILGLHGRSDERREIKKRALPFVMPLLESLRDNKMIIAQEINYPTGDNETIPLSVSAAKLISQSGEDLGAVFILRDLRKIKDLEEKVKRSERLAALGSLAAGVAHEIRNPLSSIKGFAQFFLKKASPGSTDRQYSEVMIKEVDRLNRVISNLLDFARPKEPVTEKISIIKIIHHSLELIQDDARAKDIYVVEEIEEDLPLLALDRDQMTQVLLNIELNSLDAMNKGGTLSIRCSRNEGDKTLIVELEDTGTGIPQSDLPRIFDPFYTTKRKGTGLGLAIAYRIVENHGGTLSVESTKGLGTTFRIALPIV